MTVMTSDSTTRLVVRRTLLLPPDRVFRALTEAAAMKQWFGPGLQIDRVTSDPRIGGAWTVEMSVSNGETHKVSGEYVEIAAPERLVYTWFWQSTPDRVSLVTFALRAVDGGTALTLTHDRFADTDARDRHARGWAATLDRLERLLQDGTSQNV